MKRIIRHSKREQGQTIVLVAVSLFALLSMAALAIDVTTLYVASTEAQQAADSAALAGAKVFVTSGYTSYPTNFATTDWLCNGSTGLADYAAQSAVGVNTVAGVIPTMTTSCDFTHNENPTITVQVKRTALPVFFAKIWGARSPQTSATATAEAYNPSGNSNQTPVQVAGVKPWLLANCDPTGNTSPQNSNCTVSAGPGTSFAPFVDPTDGHIENGGSFIGHTITLNISNGGALHECSSTPCPGGSSVPTMDFYPLDIPENPPTPFCAGSAQPSCGNPHGIYYDSIACFNPTTFTCGQSVNGPADSVWIDSRINTGSLKPRTDQATQCLIHESGFGALPAADCSGGPYNQDCFVVQGAGKPVLITPGQLNPDQPLRSVEYISRSDSVVTVALFDGSNLCANASNNCSQVTAGKIVGFLQLGIQTNVNTGSVQAVILNVSGCNSTVNGQPVTGGNISPVPVRLVQTP